MVRSKPSPLQVITMTTIRFDDLDDLLPSEYQDPWPPSDEDIDEMEKQADWEDLQRSIPDAPERNRNLK